MQLRRVDVAGLARIGDHLPALDLVAALDKFNVGENEKKELLGILGPLKPQIVEVNSQQTGTPLPAKFKPAPPLKEGKTKADKGKGDKDKDKSEKKKKGMY